MRRISRCSASWAPAATASMTCSPYAKSNPVSSYRRWVTDGQYGSIDSTAGEIQSADTVRSNNTGSLPRTWPDVEDDDQPSDHAAVITTFSLGNGTGPA